jgi:hypothetical protein
MDVPKGSVEILLLQSNSTKSNELTTEMRETETETNKSGRSLVTSDRCQFKYFHR